MQCGQRAPSPLSPLPAQGGRRGGDSLVTRRALPGLVETLAQVYQMPTSLREQRKLLKPRGRFGQARHLYFWGGRLGAGFPRVLPSGSTHSEWAIIDHHMYALPRGRQKGTETGNSSVGDRLVASTVQPLLRSSASIPLLRRKRQEGIFWV